jgi:hypothetical protein
MDEARHALATTRMLRVMRQAIVAVERARVMWEARDEVRVGDTWRLQSRLNYFAGRHDDAVTLARSAPRPPPHAPAPTSNGWARPYRARHDRAPAPTG